MKTQPKNKAPMPKQMPPGKGKTAAGKPAKGLPAFLQGKGMKAGGKVGKPMKGY